MATTVAEMTVAELRRLIEDVVQEKLAEMVTDPDAGLELRPELVDQLRQQMAAVGRGERGIPLAELRGRFAR